MILIVTLALLAILSILLVSFVSMASLDRGATKSYSQALRAEQTALGGLDRVVSQLQAEISDPALSANYPVVAGGVTNNLYIPLSSAASIPQRTAPYAANLATLLSYSGTNLYTVGSGATNYLSGSSTQTKSVNGRYIPTSRWNKPQLTTSTANFPDPQWILMTRSGPQSATSFTSTLADGSALNDNFVVGRYAYTVYDTSGLLDANIAGYPSTAAASASAKGLLPWTDLTKIGTGVTTTAVDNLVSWRNAATAGTYAAHVYASATNSGFTTVANGDTCFLSRQELIKYAQSQNTPLLTALPYLTTFSRELNGPTWGPTTPTGSTTDYAAQQYTAGTLNPRIGNPRVAGSFTRANGLAAVPGEPLVKYRFPLEKLALLEKYTGAGSLTAAELTDIQKYFGLDLAADATTASPQGISYRHWTYPTASTTYKHGLLSGTTGIMTLDDVAQQNREPDFFELLQAGVLAGSLGVHGRGDQRPVNTNGPAGFVDPDSSITLQILRMGTNIIDQWDADSFPTTVTYSPISTSVYGIEDLAYPMATFLKVYAATANQPPFNFYIYFQLWNPHQKPVGTVSNANYPQNFRLTPLFNSGLSEDSDFFLPGFVQQGGTGAIWKYDGSATSLTRQFLNGQQIAFTPGTTDDYREPKVVSGSTPGAPSPLSSVGCFVPNPLNAFPPQGTLSKDGTLNKPFPASPSTLNWSVDVIMSLTARLQYQDASGAWRTYSTFVGTDDTNGNYTAGTGYHVDGFMASDSTGSLSALAFVKSDPRTFRLSAGGAYYAPYNTPNQPLATSTGTMNLAVTAVPPFSSLNAAGPPTTRLYRLDMWAANDTAVSVPTSPLQHSTSTYYPDVDGIQRWGDARNSYKFATSTSPFFTGNDANRPVMLNRPFVSVGELGYAYRDMPWKTLDLFSATSADSGLLDLFTISDAPIVAGRVNPNTPYQQVLAAMISGATQSTSSGTTVSSANATTVAKAIQTVTAATPFVNRADLVNNFMTNAAVKTMAPSGIKTEAEAAVRAVAESANTRTWTFLVDVIAQAGRYPAAAGSLDSFVVEGERRYWLHVAIDRYTGQVVDKQLEVVNE